jgi:Concanavalin A-like lectin/glucanases superfamily
MRSGALLAIASIAAGCGRWHFDNVPDALPAAIVRYPMDDDPSAGTIACTVPALTASCTTTCPTSAVGHIKGAYAFDGTTARFEVPSSTLVGIAPFTVSVWIFPDHILLDHSIVNKVFSLTMNHDVFNLVVSPGNGMLYESYDGATYDFVKAIGVSVYDQWHHVAASWDGTTKRLYIDGVLVGSGVPAHFLDSSVPLEVGADLEVGVPSFYYRGLMDELTFYDSALSDAQIAILAAQ